MVKKRTAHNDLDELPEEKQPVNYDSEDISQVFPPDVARKIGASKKQTPPEDVAEEKDQAIKAVADEASEEGEEQTSEEEPQPDEKGKAEETPGEPPEEAAAEPKPKEGEGEDDDELEDVTLEGRDGFKLTIQATKKEAKYLRNLAATAGQFPGLQKTHALTKRELEELKRRVEEGSKATPPDTRPVEQPPVATQDQVIEQTMRQIPALTETYRPVMEKIRTILPENHKIRDFLDDYPPVAAVILSLWDASQEQRQATATVQQGQFAQRFKARVDSVYQYVSEQGDDLNGLADPSTREAFDTYLVNLMPVRTVQAILASDQAPGWVAERYRDFVARKAITDAEALIGAAAEAPPPDPAKATRQAAERRRASDRGGGASRPTVRRTTRRAKFDEDIEGVMRARRN